MSDWKRPASRRGSPSPEIRDDRRSVYRTRPLIRDVVLGREQDGTMVESPVWLKDVSLQGCQAKSRSLPVSKVGDFIWFKVPGCTCSDWIEGILIEARKAFLGHWSIRIQFLAPLPYSVFKYLVYGPESVLETKRITPEHETDALWK